MIDHHVLKSQDFFVESGFKKKKTHPGNSLSIPDEDQTIIMVVS